MRARARQPRVQRRLARIRWPDQRNLRRTLGPDHQRRAAASASFSGPLELAVRRLTFDSATAFGIYDRGLVQPGMAADLVVFDPDTVQPLTQDVVHDFPNDGWRMRELAEGIHYTVVNGEVLLEKGTHTGSYPGRVLHNARYHNGRS